MPNDYKPLADAAAPQPARTIALNSKGEHKQHDDGLSKKFAEYRTITQALDGIKDSTPIRDRLNIFNKYITLISKAENPTQDERITLADTYCKRAKIPGSSNFQPMLDLKDAVNIYRDILSQPANMHNWEIKGKLAKAFYSLATTIEESGFDNAKLTEGELITADECRTEAACYSRDTKYKAWGGLLPGAEIKDWCAMVEQSSGSRVR